MASEFEPIAPFAKLNIENEQIIASLYGIFSVWTLIIFKNGKEISRQSGSLDLGNLA